MVFHNNNHDENNSKKIKLDFFISCFQSARVLAYCVLACFTSEDKENALV